MSPRPAKRRKKRAAQPPPAQPLPKGVPRRLERRSDGRVHLALVTDPESQRERLDLALPVFVEDWQNRLTLAAANTAYAILRAQGGVGGAVQLGQAAMASTSTLVGGLLARTPPGSIACKSGCDHCCHQSVGVTPPEALAIHAHLLETRTLAELEQVREKVRDFCRRTLGLSSSERISPELPCPFLDHHACSIYEVRPLSCRGMNSLDADICARKLQDPEVRQASLEGRLPGHVLVEPIRAFHAISAGLQLALAECFGLDMRPLDLALVLDLLLSEGEPETATPERSLADRWLEREPAFSPARGGDASADASRVGLAGVAKLP